MKTTNRLKAAITWAILAMVLVTASLFPRASSEVTAAANQPSDELTPELKQDIEGILQQAKLQLKSSISLHLRFDYCQKDWSLLEGKFLTPPQDNLGEATLDIANRKVRFRVDFKPSVGRWTDGAQPYLIKNETEITDGQQTWNSSWDHVGKEAGDLGYLLGYRYRADRQVQGSALWILLNYYGIGMGGSSSVDVQSDVQKTTLKGQPVVRVQEMTKTGTGMNRQRWWLDPLRNYALIQYEREGFQGNSSQPMGSELTNVKELQQIAPGVWYPTQFTTEISSYKDGKLDDSSFQATTKLTNLTILSKVNDRIFQQ